MISRPFALIGFSLTPALLILNLFEGITVLLLLSCVGCLAVCVFARGFAHKAKVSVVLLSIICACALFAFHEKYVYGDAMRFVAAQAQVRAKIISLPEKTSNGWFYTLETEKINGEDTRQKIDFYSETVIDAGPCDILEFSGKLSSSSVDISNKADGVFLQCFYHDGLKVFTGEERSVNYWLLTIKEYISQRLNTLMPDAQAAVAVAMLTGDKNGLEPQVKTSFRRAGLSHVLAVSGLHMSILVMGLYKLITRFSRRNIGITGAICIAVSFLYAGVSGFSMSAVRSAFMISCMLIGRSLTRQPDAFNSMGASALLILLINPYAVLDWSFMLSFSATAGIIGFLPAMGRIIGSVGDKIHLKPLRTILNTVLSTVLISLTATVSCLPVTVFIIKEISLAFLPSNLLSIVLVPLILVTALAAVPPLGIVSWLISQVCALACSLMLRIAASVSALPYSDISADSHCVRITLISAAVIIVLSLILIKDKKRLFRACACVVVFSVAVNVAIGIYNGIGRVEIYCEKGNVVVCDGSRAVAICASDDALYCVADALDRFEALSVTLIYPRYDTTVDFYTAKSFAQMYCVEQVVSVKENCFDLYCEKFTVEQDVQLELDSTRLDILMGNNGGCFIGNEAADVYHAFSKYSPLKQADFLLCGKYYDKADKSDYSAVISYWDGIDVNKNSDELVKYDNYAALCFNAWGKYTIEGG